MRTNNDGSLIAFVAAFVAMIFVLPARVPGQTPSLKSESRREKSATQWSVQVEQVDPANVELAYSFQIAIYENLVEELIKTKQFSQVFRDGDLTASEVPNLLILKTTVEKYTPGNETRRAVTTVSGATKLTVRSQLLTSESGLVLERTLNGDVRFFGSNLRVTHNLAHNIAKTLKKSSLSDFPEPTAILSVQP